MGIGSFALASFAFLVRSGAPALLPLVLMVIVFFIHVLSLIWALAPWLQVSPWLLPLSNPALAAIQQDRYYRLLIPFTLPVALLAITANWFSMKVSRHWGGTGMRNRYVEKGT